MHDNRLRVTIIYFPKFWKQSRTVRTSQRLRYMSIFLINLTLAFCQKLSCTKLRTKHRWNDSCKITLQLAFLKFCNMTSFETSELLFSKYVPIRNSSYTQLMKTVIMQRTWHAHTFHCIHSDSHILEVSSWVVKTSVGESGVIWRLFFKQLLLETAIKLHNTFKGNLC